MQINDDADFLMFIGDYQTNKSNPKESGGIRVVKTDSAFNIMWYKNITDTNNVEWPYRAIKINDNRYIVLVANYTLKTSNEIECAKLYLIDSNALVLNTYSFPCGSLGSERVFFGLRFYEHTPEGNILIAGNYFDDKNTPTAQDAFLVQIKPDLSIVQQQPDNRVYKNACGEQWKNTTYELPEPVIIPISQDSFPRSIAPVYSVGPGIKSTASIEKTRAGKAMAVIYPNPTSDFLEFYSEDFKQINQVDFEIYNHIGQLVSSQSRQPIINGRFTIHVQELPTGNYHLKVNGKEHTVNFKLVVE